MQNSQTYMKMRSKSKVAEWNIPYEKENKAEHDKEESDLEAGARAESPRRGAWKSVKKVGSQMKTGVGRAAQFIRKKTKSKKKRNAVSEISIQPESPELDEVWQESHTRSTNNSASSSRNRTPLPGEARCNENNHSEEEADDHIPVVSVLEDVEDDDITQVL